MFAGRDRLLSITYHSAAIPGFDQGDLDDLLAASRTRNRARNVTGMLLMENGRFLQAIEGPEPAVRDLMATIAADPRHQHVRVLAEEQVASRRFPDWEMARGHVGEAESVPLARYGEVFAAAREDVEEDTESPTLGERLAAWARMLSRPAH